MRLPFAWIVSKIGCRPDLIAKVPVNSGRTIIKSKVFHSDERFSLAYAHRSCALGEDISHEINNNKNRDSY